MTGDPLRVLVVEDSPEDTARILDRLRRGGLDVRRVRVEADTDFARALADGPWDLVLLDGSVSGPASHHALRRVRSEDPDLPVIVVSGTLDAEAAVLLLKAGASDCLPKDRLGRLVPAVRRETEEGRLRRERRRAIEEVERAHSRFRSLVENAVVGVARGGPDRRFSFVNGALVAMLEYASKEDLLACDPALDVFRDPQDLERILALGPADKVDAMECVWRSRRGKPVHVRIWARATTRSETPNGFEMFVEDVTERRALRSQLEQAQKMEAVGRLAGGIAHDFNNILVAILGYADLLKTTMPPDDPRQRSIEQIQKAGERAAGLTRRLLAFSRRQVLERTAIRLNEVVLDVKGMLERVIGEDVVLETRLFADLPAVLADRGQVEQVLVNLAVNARDAMPHGGRLTIATRSLNLSEALAAVPGAIPPGAYACLSVEDTGHGMSDEVKAHLFEPFFTTKEPGKGTGLGLSTVYGIVTQCEGALRVASEPGTGTTIEIYLPVSDASAARPRSASAGGARRPVPRRRGGETILFVEDDAAVRDFGREILEAAGYVVLTAESAREAAERLERLDSPPDALVTDVVLPDVSGVELAERVRARHPAVRVLLTSGHTAHSLDLRALESMRAPYLQKPYRASAILEKLRAVLDEREEPPPSPSRPPPTAEA